MSDEPVEKIATCIGHLRFAGGGQMWTYRLEPPVDAKGELRRQVTVRREPGSMQVWSDPQGNTTPTRLIVMSPGHDDPGETLRLWQGYAEPALSQLRRAAGVFDDAVPFPTGNAYAAQFLRPLRSLWGGLSVEARLAAMLAAVEAVAALRFPPLDGVQAARAALRELDRQLQRLDPTPVECDDDEELDDGDWDDDEELDDGDWD